MIDPHLRLRHLRCFLETARLGSLSAAAQSLNVSQPAASKTIRELERILEADLFDRSGRRLTLSRAGKTFQQHAGAAMVDLARAQALVRGKAQTRTRIAVGVLPTAATDLFPLAALKFREARPDCVVRVSTGPNWMLLSQLREGALDMVVGRAPRPVIADGLSFRQVYSEHVCPVVRSGHPLARPDWTPAELTDYPLMLPPSGAVIAPMVRAFLHQHGVPDPDPDFESVSLAFGRRVVASSDTVWFISEGVVRNELDQGTLTALPMKDVLLGGPVGVCLREGALLSEEQRVLLEILLETAEGLRSDI